MGRVIIIGSINQDITITVDRLPEPGETLSGTSLIRRLGGKGANQSAASAHAGAQTLFIGRVGADQSGPALRDELSSHGVDVSHLLVDGDTTTGIAMITVSASGENTIVLNAGANGRVTADQAREAVEPSREDVVVLQGEIDAGVNEQVISWAHRAGARIVFNVAPAYRAAPEVLALVDCVVVNETEAGVVLDRPAPRDADSALDAATALVDLGPRLALVTLGEHGAAWSDGDRSEHVPALDLGPVVDTTGAGDASVGTLAAALATGSDFPGAVEAGMRAGSTAVLAEGAAASYAGIEPFRAF
ncbi:ribokinase [uncultured Propionibacterium sp.]|uniref:ribokinase n=1 Tax=uncultured Propionibacterium sp. TaxID=218066 RepID=UPI002931E8D4|nr:ribokinase [uncultured Propionibacterium sp.]